jgi:pimeloyl-ACP methyl ester carboxylesterase
MFPIVETVLETDRHRTFYLSCGAADATPIVFVHGWPELSISWRHQLPCFGSLGFRAVAPDMRGYGRSGVYTRHEDYALSHIVADMIELLDALGRDRAIWVGHDWGSPVVWSIASQHPDRCHGVASLCVPYFARGFAPEVLVPLVDRAVYPEEQYPAGQWEYQLFYEESFDRARTAFEANVRNTVKALFRKGNPGGQGKPSRTALVRRDGGWFGGAGHAPDLPMDPDILTEDDLARYVAALEASGFFGPDSWYMNHRENLAYASRAVDGGALAMPVLFLHGRYDYTCETVTSRLAEPMRRDCRNLTEAIVASGHWMAQEKPIAVNAALAKWLAAQLPRVWTI